MSGKFRPGLKPGWGEGRASWDLRRMDGFCSLSFRSRGHTMHTGHAHSQRWTLICIYIYYLVTGDHFLGGTSLFRVVPSVKFE